MFGIVVGDVILFTVTIQVGRMTAKIGRKLPSRNLRLSRRYYRSIVLPWAFGHAGLFYWMLLLFSVLGAVALVNQSVQLLNPFLYYGHDTFDAYAHPWSFWVNRVNLATSWCIVIPLFAACLFSHSLSMRAFFRKCMARGLAEFRKDHPDKCGGYSFFGWLDTLYVFGILIVLIEAVLLIVTHRNITAGNVLALFAVGFGALLISTFSIAEAVLLVRRLERSLKASSFGRRLRRRGRTNLDYATLVFGLRFSPYTATAGKLAVGLRAVFAVPGLYRLMQLFSGPA
jgi:hypothetical protein